MPTQCPNLPIPTLKKVSHLFSCVVVNPLSGLRSSSWRSKVRLCAFAAACRNASAQLAPFYARLLRTLSDVLLLLLLTRDHAADAAAGVEVGGVRRVGVGGA